MSDSKSPQPDFSDLALIAPVLKALNDVGYETPSPIQALTIPLMLAGKDVVGEAHTGTGKTAAFALPLLSRIDLKNLRPQVLVLTPTRELAIQVAEAFQRYAAHMKGFHVMPIYGGQDYRGQLRQLKRGVHVVVGTPGRVMDHMRRGTLKLEALNCLVLDEADEMLRMGFIEDVEWILEQTPEQRQVALFSATMPTVIRRIARKHLHDPQEVTIKVRTTTATSIRQRFWMVSGLHKLDALTRILEAESFDGILIFVRTKIATVELAEKIQARGYAAAALNGDMAQKLRERTVEQFKKNQFDILIATDVAARGLDLERISHVINYDIPYDTEAYVHRIGRTGRFGRKGEAILFVAPRERRMLQMIEKATRQKISMMELPSTEMLNDKRIALFKQRISDTLATEGLDFFYQLIEQYQQEHNIPALEIAAALAKQVQGKEPLLLKPQSKKARAEKRDRRPDRKPEDYPTREEKRPVREKGAARQQHGGKTKKGMQRFRLEVGEKDGVKPGNIVGAIANEAGLEARHIDQITIHENYSTVDLPESMPKEIFRALKKAWVCGCQLNISKLEQTTGGRGHPDKDPKHETTGRQERPEKRASWGTTDGQDRNKKRSSQAKNKPKRKKQK